MVEGVVETQDTPRRRSRRGRALSAAVLPARDRAHRKRCRDRRFRRERALRQRQGSVEPAAHADERAQPRDHLRHQPDPCRHHRGGSLQAAPRRLPGPDPHLHRRGAPARHSGALYRRSFPPRRRRHRAGGRPRLGRGLYRESGLGRLRRHQRHFARPRRMCGWRSASIISAPRRCAAPVLAAPASASQSPCTSIRRAASRSLSATKSTLPEAQARRYNLPARKNRIDRKP